MSHATDLECPLCGACVPYDEAQVVEDDETKTGCPECGEASPTDDWFA